MALFVADEQLPDALAAAVRESGHDAVTVKQAGLQGAADGDVLAFARQARALLITSDRGFGNLERYPLAIHAGIILLRLEPHLAYPRIIDRLLEVLSQYSIEQLAGGLTVVQPTSVRIRRPS
jgi:predicted nuclease of predicted toxin-antitoxin system